MRKRALEFFIVDILIAIDKIKRMMHGINSVEMFIENECVFDAVMRELEILGEATNQLLKSEKFQPFINVEWRKIVDLRNVIIHEYFGIDAALVFDAVSFNVPDFEREIIMLVRKIKYDPLLKIAFEDSKKMLSRMHRSDSIQYLEKIELLILN